MSYVARTEELLLAALRQRARHPHPSPVSVPVPVAPACPIATIRVFDRSRAVTAADLLQHLPVQAQVCLDFAPLWLSEGALVLDDGSGLKAGEWWIELVDADPSVPGALGFHEDIGGVPAGHVFAATAAQAGVAWTSVFSHELLEMLGDPRANMIVPVDHDSRGTSGVEYWAEACDAVEQAEYAITVAGVQTTVSDFVTPRWFDPVAMTGPYDFLRKLRFPLQLLPGGSYIGTRTISSPGWRQQQAETAPSSGIPG